MNTKSLNVLVAFTFVVFLAVFSFGLTSNFDPVTITTFPLVPKEGGPVFVTINLNNPLQTSNTLSYELYANGELLMDGVESLEPESTNQFVYVYPDAPGLGERVLFLVKGRSNHGPFEKTLSLPSYPPQVWSSFVSFATFSTSIMGSTMGSSMSSSMGSTMTTAGFYDNNFVNSNTINVGLLFSIVLIGLLVFLELSEPIHGKGIKIKGLRIRFSRLSAILFVVFIGMVLTKVVMVIG